MAAVDKSANGKYRARWRTADGRTQSKSSFRLKSEAMAYAKQQEVAIVTGSYIAPSAGKGTFQDFAEEWRKIQTHRKGTAVQVEGNFRRNVYPFIGSLPLKSVRRSHIQNLLKSLSDKLAPATVEVVFRYVSAAFSAAVADKLISENPCKGLKPPKGEKARVEPLSIEAVHAITEAMPDRYRALIILAAGTGLRQGEAFGLTVDRVDFLRRTLRVDRQLQLQKGVGAVLVPPKTQASYRTVPLAQVVVEALSKHLAEFGAGEDGLIFTDPTGKPLNRHRFSEVWKRSVDMEATFHDLRHFYASVLIRSGASVKVVQERLGHASAMETLDTYAHLFPDEEDRSRQAVEDVLGAKPVDKSIDHKERLADNT